MFQTNGVASRNKHTFVIVLIRNGVYENEAEDQFTDLVSPFSIYVICKISQIFVFLIQMISSNNWQHKQQI